MPSVAKKKIERPGLFARLKQHHMFRVASWYATAAYVLVLVANAVFPDIGLTREDVRYVIAALALGFPVVLVLSWMFVPPLQEDPQSFSRWQRLRWRLGSVMALVVIAFVCVSGAYLWQLNARHAEAAPAAGAVVVLPFDKLGPVDDDLIRDIQHSMEATLSNLGSVRVISHGAIPAALGTHPSLHDLAKATGATLAIQGTVQRASGGDSYIIQEQLVAVDEAEPLFSGTDMVPTKADHDSISQQIAWYLAGPVQFVTRGDDWLAPGYPTTRNLRALALLRKALMEYYYGDPSGALRTTQEAVGLDPDFAQAHAYLAVFEKQDDEWRNNSEAIAAEIAKAGQLEPGLPEAAMARGSLEFHDGQFADAAKTLEAVRVPLAKSFWLHFDLARSYRYLGRWDDAIHEFQQAEAIDPYQTRVAYYISLIEYAKRDYETAISILKQTGRQLPLLTNYVIWQAQVQFGFHGDLLALARVIDGDWSYYMTNDGTRGDVEVRQIELTHMQGKHAEVLARLRSYPHDVLQWGLFGPINGRITYRDTLIAESLLLMGRAADARREAALALPQAESEVGHSEVPFDTLHPALLQAYGGDAGAALGTVAPLLKELDKPVGSWTSDEAVASVDVAVVLAWSGEKKQAIDLLSRSLDAVWGAHAAVLAHDPVWRPLYTEPAFAALLAAHGQKLVYAK